MASYTEFSTLPLEVVRLEKLKGSGYLDVIQSQSVPPLRRTPRRILGPPRHVLLPTKDALPL